MKQEIHNDIVMFMVKHLFLRRKKKPRISNNMIDHISRVVFFNLLNFFLKLNRPNIKVGKRNP